MKKKLKAVSPESVSEKIIIAQSFYLLVFGVAGVMATSSVVAGFNALRNLNSAVAIITDKGIVTDQGDVSLEQVTGVIDNFELIAISGIAVGLTVGTATIARLYIKNKLKNKPRRRVVFAKRKRG
jgi:hypothetical protein